MNPPIRAGSEHKKIDCKLITLKGMRLFTDDTFDLNILKKLNY
jgi:hypothetical protein